MTSAKKIKNQEQLREIAKYVKRMRGFLMLGETLPVTKPMNRVFKDIFGVKKAGTRLMGRAVDNMQLFNEIGAPIVKTICTERDIYEVFYNLILCAAAIDDLEDKIAKNQKRNKPVKEKWIDKLEDYEKEYKRTVKSFQKMFNVSSKKDLSVLRKFNKARKSGYGYGFSSDWEDPFYGESWGGFWDDDDEDDELFMVGVSPKKQDRRMKNDITLGINFDDEDDDEDDELYDDMFEQMDSRMERMEKAIISLAQTQKVSCDCETPKSKKPSVSKIVRDSDGDVSSLATSVNKLIGMVGGLKDNQDKLSELVAEMYDDLYEEGEDDGADDDASAISKDQRAEIDAQIMQDLMGE